MDTTTTHQAPPPAASDDAVEIEYIEDENALYDRYPGQTSPQPCFVELDCMTGKLGAAVSPEIGNAVPFDVHHRLRLRWSIPALRTKVANDLLDEIAPEAARILAGFDTVWAGRGRIGTFDADANEAIESVARLCDRDWDADECVEAWDAAHWLGGVGNRDAQRTSLGITATTTDEELAAIVAREEREAAPREIDGLDRYLTGLRDEARDALAENSTEDEDENADEDAEENGVVDPRTGETLAAFTARHEGEGHYVWSEEDTAFAYETEEDSDRDRDSSGELSDELVIEVWRASGAKD